MPKYGKKLERDDATPAKFATPTKTLARSDGTPALLNTVEEKQKTAFIPDSCCKANRVDPIKTTAKGISKYNNLCQEQIILNCNIEGYVGNITYVKHCSSNL